MISTGFGKNPFHLGKKTCIDAAVAVLIALAALSISSHGCSGEDVPKLSSHPKGIIILGLDGLDPLVLEECFRRGLTPRMQAMAENGTFVPLGTSTPPQSPVAWADFITGMDPSGHGIYDFIHRDLQTMSPYLSTSRTEPPKYTLTIRDWVLPLSSGSVTLLRKGRPFWEYLVDKKIPAVVVKLPSHFPPEGRAKVLSGMGTPDLMGTYGTFQLWSDDPGWAEKNLQGGIFHELGFTRGNRAETIVQGPPNPMDRLSRPINIPVEIIRDRTEPVVLIRVQENEIMLAESEWSDWIQVNFSPGLLAGSIPGIVRFYVKSVHPRTTVYLSPVNIDPMEPSMPVSTPPSYSRDLAEHVGRFYTQGMAEDTKAFESDVFTDAEFLELAEQILENRVQMLRTELERFRGGLLFVYFSSTDQVSHMFWRTLDPESEHFIETDDNPIYRLYTRMDEVVGEVLDTMRPNTELIIMSDHGFANCSRNFGLNTWLAQQGWLTPKAAMEGKMRGPLDYIDWSRTQAYGMGLNGLYINLEGREPHGTVPRSERTAVLNRIGNQLRNFRDPENGQQVVTRTFILPIREAGNNAPDMIVGYNRGYRCAGESAVGGMTENVLERNTDKWSGDHSMDPALVPGVFLSTMRTDHSDPALVDIGPTVLEFFDIDPPGRMIGKNLFEKETKEK